ncbi:MAG: xanthine dehydrogenase family protein molybdopterin-binding subunit [Ignavibacteria bacterium]|nr:xanthine dehydrogenase family protein molybdopterin-binding subunit [Ignavibacteria bacterium]
MNTTSTVSRRDFVKIVSVAGSGLVLGFHLPSREALADTSRLSPITFSPNAWLSIRPPATAGQSGVVTITIARTEMGQGVWTSMSMLVAEELEADWKSIRVEQADAHPNKYGSQSTGGSMSVRGSYMPLRKAGATAREMLLTAASQQWKVERSTCKAENGYVVHSSGKKLSYGELCSAAAGIPVPEDVPLKDEKNFRFLGKRIPKLDSPEKVRGSAQFGIDVRVPKMLFASIERPPVFGGKPAQFDATATQKVAGVVNVFEVNAGIAVVATSTWSALKGREALVVSWKEGRWAEQSSAKIRETFANAVTSEGTSVLSRGNANEALAGAATTIESVYEIPFVAHATMEPMNCIADVRENKCEIWAPTQNPQSAQSSVAQTLGIPQENVTVHVTLLGGGFGRRLNADYAVDAAQVSKKANVPVQVVWTREDDMTHDFYRPGTYNVLRGGLDVQGKPVAWLHRVAGPNSRGLVVGGSTPPYDIPNLQIDAHLIDVGVPVGAWRSVGPSQNGLIVEAFIDELAHAAKQDPVSFRLGLLTKQPRANRALEAVAEKAGWGKPAPKGIGRGVSVVESFGSAAAQVAEVSVSPDGRVRVHRMVCAIDCGPVVNPDTIEQQIEGGVVFALSAIMHDEITLEKGRVQQKNFDDYRIPTFDEVPKIEIHILKSPDAIGGIGEPSVPPTAPAVLNAIFAATGKRIRRVPIRAEDLRA